MNCEVTIAEDTDDKTAVKNALEILRARFASGESAERILRSYFEGQLSLASVKRFLKKGSAPRQQATRKLVVDAGRRAWAGHCALARLYDVFKGSLLPDGENDVRRFYGEYRAVLQKPKADDHGRDFAVVFGACKGCGRPLFSVEGHLEKRTGLIFNVGTRLYMFAIGRNYMRCAIVRPPVDPKLDCAVGVLVADDHGLNEVLGTKMALVPEGSGWFDREADDIRSRMGQGRMPPGMIDSSSQLVRLERAETKGTKNPSGT